MSAHPARKVTFKRVDAIRTPIERTGGAISSAIKKVKSKRSGAAEAGSVLTVSEQLHDDYTDDELQEFHQVFSMFDTDQSGSIGVEELAIAMKSMGLNPANNELETLIREVDQDGNGEVDFEEFCGVMRRMSTNKTSWKQVVKKCFEVFDRGENGYILETDFRYVLQQMGDIKESSIVDEIFAEVDVDGNGVIDLEEFTAMVKNYLSNEDLQTM